MRPVGDIDAARRLHEDTIRRARRILGEDHSYTLDAANFVVRDLLAAGETDAARQLAQDTHARARRVLGDRGPMTITAANSLAIALGTLGNVDAARRLGEATLAIALQLVQIANADMPGYLGASRPSPDAGQ